jgi:hypothetical protein
LPQDDPNLHARNLANNQPRQYSNQPGQYPYQPGQDDPYTPVQPPPTPWARRHPFFFWLGVVATGLIVSAVIVTATGSNSPAPVSAVPGICTRTVLPDLRSIQNDIARGGGGYDTNYTAAATTAMTADNAVMNDDPSGIGSNLDTDLTQLATDLKASTHDGSAIQHDIANVEGDCK